MRTADYRSGYWAALNAVLNYLNTLEYNRVDKKEIYKHVFDMRPPIENR